jgi:hypothetical protein
MINEKHYFAKLETELISRITWRNFISTHCNQVEIRPWLTMGSLICIDQLCLWHPQAYYGIILNSNLYQSEGFNTEVSETLFHEVVHLSCRVIGLCNHSENEVERVCRILTRKYPFILEVFEGLFPGLKFNKQFFAQAFEKPVSISLPIPTN